MLGSLCIYAASTVGVGGCEQTGRLRQKGSFEVVLLQS